MCSLEKRNSLFILTLTGNNEHRLNPALIDAIRSALARVRSESSSSSPSTLITTAHGKFFSNGYDLDWAKNSGPSAAAGERLQLMSFKLRSLVRELISLPMPTIAAVSGHASAAGFILALSHDYVLMRKDRGFLYMSELDIGLKIPAWFVTVVRSKVSSLMARREVVLKAAKLTAAAAAEKGIIDSAHDNAETTLEAAAKLGESLARRGCDGHVYGKIRSILFADVLAAIECDETVEDVTKIASRI